MSDAQPKQPKGKSGALSNEEKKFITDNAGRMHPADIAAALGRSLDVVMNFLKKTAPAAAAEAHKETVEQSVIRVGLKQSPAWKRLGRELERDELAYFESAYVDLMSQFKDDVLATEENQIFKAIKYDILMGRNLAQQKAANKEITRIEREQERVSAQKKIVQNDLDYLESLATQFKDALKLRQALSEEFTKLDHNHQRILEDLKALRKQRVDKIESGKQDFIGMIRLLQEEAFRNDKDREIELMRRATAGEEARLSQPYRYSDGTFDRPLLTPESVLLDGDAHPPVGLPKQPERSDHAPA